MKKIVSFLIMAPLLIGTGCSNQKEFSWPSSIATLVQKGWDVSVKSDGQAYLNAELKRYGYTGSVQLDAKVVAVDPMSGYDAPGTDYSAIFYKLNTQSMANDVYETLTNSGLHGLYKAALFGYVVVTTNSETAMEITGGSYAII
jgi:hypothetical protein